MALRHCSTPAERTPIAVPLLAHAGAYGTVTARQQQYAVSRPTLYAWRAQAHAARAAVFAPPAPVAPRALDRTIHALLVLGHKVPTEVSLEAAQEAARNTALALLTSLKREIGDLDRVSAGLIVHGMVNAEPGYPQTSNAINGFSNLILELYGPTVGQHARTAVGMAALPLNNAVTIAAEVEITR